MPDAEGLAQRNNIEIIYSSPALEYWFRRHFANCPRSHFADGAAVIGELDKHWNNVCKAAYNKADRDIFDRLSPLLNTAREQALRTDPQHIAQSGQYRRINPSTQVYELIALLLGSNG